MGQRKHIMAEQLKEERKTQYMAKLNNCPTSPRKMRIVADLIRGEEVTKASYILKFSKQDAARRLEKLLNSAIANFEAKSGERVEDTELFVSEIKVDQSRTLKRIQPAPQGRAHRIRKRSNHVTIVLDRAADYEYVETETETNEEA